MPLDLYAIVLAAGTGSRFGGRKLLAPWRSGLLLHGALRAAFEAPVAGIILVTGADGEEVASAGESFAEKQGEARLLARHAADYRDGAAASLRAGISALPPSAAAAFVFLGDMPRIPVDVAVQLAKAFEETGALAAAPTHEGKRGHPVLLGRAIFPDLMKLRGDTGARQVLQALGSALALVPTSDPGILFDVDKAEDLHQDAVR